MRRKTKEDVAITFLEVEEGYLPESAVVFFDYEKYAEYKAEKECGKFIMGGFMTRSQEKSEPVYDRPFFLTNSTDAKTLITEALRKEPKEDPSRKQSYPYHEGR